MTSLVYIVAFAPDEGQSLSNLVDAAALRSRFLVFDSGGFAYISPDMFPPQAFAQDVNTTEAETMAIVHKPANQSMLTEKSDPPAWKQLPTWYQVSVTTLSRLMPSVNSRWR